MIRLRNEDLAGRMFRFERIDGSVISATLRLHPDGAIEGAAHPNESAWHLTNGVLTFHHASGGVSTRFDEVVRIDGMLTLTGPFLFRDASRPWHRLREVRAEAPADPPETPLTPAMLTGGPFALKDAAGKVIAPAVWFLGDGRVFGTRNPCHERWAIEANRLVIRASDGAVFWTLRAGLTGDGTLALVGGPPGSPVTATDAICFFAEARGPWRPPPVLERRRQAETGRALVLVRTHQVNDKVADLTRALEATADTYDVALLVDETNGRPPVTHERIVWHSVAACADLGLPMPAERMLWWCGDYPLYFAARQYPQYAWYVMIEYDVHLTAGDGRLIRDLVDRLMNGPARFDCVGLRLRHGGLRDDRILSAAFRRGNDVHSYFLPVLALSRPAVNYLFLDRRLEAARGTRPEDVIYCEPFIPMALLEGGFTVGDLNEVIPGCYDDRLMVLPSRFLGLPRSLAAGFAAYSGMIHPVYDDAEFLERFIARIRTAEWQAYFLRTLDDPGLAAIPVALRESFAARARALLADHPDHVG